MPDPVSSLCPSLASCSVDNSPADEPSSCGPVDPSANLNVCPAPDDDFSAGVAALTAKFRSPDTVSGTANVQSCGANSSSANGGASGQGEGGSEGTTSGAGYSRAPSGNGYTDYNVTVGVGVGVTGGVMVDQYDQMHPYVGAGLMTPGICVGISESVKGAVSPGHWSAQYSVSGFGSSASAGYGDRDAFAETGSSFPPTPGQSLTGYYTW